MSFDNAKALVAKLHSDEALMKEFSGAKADTDFLELVKKHGYDVTVEDFKAALKEFKESNKELSDKQLDQVAGGISIVGVDYAIVGTELSQG